MSNGHPDMTMPQLVAEYGRAKAIRILHQMNGQTYEIGKDGRPIYYGYDIQRALGRIK
jgi:hypothetical protein